MAQNIVIVNTGCANIASVKFALERLNVDVTVSEDADVIRQADKVFLPGVGTAAAAMTSIRAKQLEQTLRELTQPVLGACLGMQLMVARSDESRTGAVECLGMMPGKVKRMVANGVRLPHMGWNTVTASRDNPLFAGIDDGTYFYFVHSFAVTEYEHTLATCEYGQTFSAAINKDNFFGVQFHPERSGAAGARLLQNFVDM